MIDKELWMHDIVNKLKRQFGNRLLFVGLQGSYLRDEATEASDIDVMVVLDNLSIADLKAYRSIIKTMPNNEKACGFISGKDELRNWPKHEIFQLGQDTKNYFGDLGSLLPPYDKTDIRQSIKIATANLYHATCHQYLYGSDDVRAMNLEPLYKSVFFILQIVEYLRSGKYYNSKTVLIEHLADEEKRLIIISKEWDKHYNDITANTGIYYEKLINWCKVVMC